MSTSAKAFFASLIVVSILGVSLGYDGIARIKKSHVPPFSNPNGFYNVVYVTAPPPEKLVLAWNSSTGKFLICGGCILVPIIVGVMLSKDLRILAWLTIFVWTTFAGLVGVWIWVFAMFNATGLD